MWVRERHERHRIRNHRQPVVRHRAPAPPRAGPRDLWRADDRDLALRRGPLVRAPPAASRPRDAVPAVTSSGSVRKEVAPMTEDELAALEQEGWDALSTHGDAARAFYDRV